MTEKLFCYAPWSNLEILPSGEILPCCKFQSLPGAQTFNIVQHDIQDFRNSQLLSSVKQDFIQGKWPAGCNRCRIEESSGIKSKRNLDYERWHTHYSSYDLDSENILTISMALGNTCNLKCIICNPTASSKWQKEYADIYNIKVDSISSVRKKVINGITDIAPNLVHVDVHGGEPFLSGIEEHRDFLDHYINNGCAGDVSIHYTTNGTVWPDQEWFDRWKHFKEIDLQISIDGINQRYEYLRYPASWSTLEANVQQYIAYEKTQSNFRLSVAHTVSAYNVYYLEEFIIWCNNVGLPSPWIGKLHRPSVLRPTVWSKDAKMHIIKHLESSQLAEVKKWAHHLTTIDDSTEFEVFVKRTHAHDKYRSLDFKKTFPELATYI
jgi:MoaA/NifB/PqqE/SkfB family radical SAM enzyme